MMMMILMTTTTLQSAWRPQTLSRPNPWMDPDHVEATLCGRLRLQIAVGTDAIEQTLQSHICSLSVHGGTSQTSLRFDAASRGNVAVSYSCLISTGKQDNRVVVEVRRLRQSAAWAGLGMTNSASLNDKPFIKRRCYVSIAVSAKIQTHDVCWRRRKRRRPLLTLATLFNHCTTKQCYLRLFCLQMRDCWSLGRPTLMLASPQWLTYCLLCRIWLF